MRGVLGYNYHHGRAPKSLAPKQDSGSVRRFGRPAGDPTDTITDTDDLERGGVEELILQQVAR